MTRSQWLYAAERALTHGDGTKYLSPEMDDELWSYVHILIKDRMELSSPDEFCLHILLLAEIQKSLREKA